MEFYNPIFWILILAAIVSVIRLIYSESRITLVVVFCFTLIALVWAAFWCWFFRDGLGPDSVTSTGLVAWRRFGSDMLFPASICILISIIAIGFFWWRQRAHDVA
jgi:hypothetical protein